MNGNDQTSADRCTQVRDQCSTTYLYYTLYDIRIWDERLASVAYKPQLLKIFFFSVSSYSSFFCIWKKCVILDFGQIILFIRRQLRNTSQNNDALCFDFFSNHVCDFGFETIYHVQNSCADKINEIINNFPKSIFLVLSDAGWFSRIKKKKFGASFLRFLNNELKKEKYCRFLRN